MIRLSILLGTIFLASCDSNTSTQCINEFADDPACQLDKSVPTSLPALNAESLTSGAASSTSLSLTWSAAVDESGNDLWYLAVAAKDDGAFESVESALRFLKQSSFEGGTSGEWQKDITSGTITGLSAGTTYKVTVLVRNRGKVRMYNVIEMATDGDANGGAITAGSPITASAIGPWSMSLSWGPAKSATNAELSYKVVFSKDPDDIDSIKKAEAMAAPGVIQDWAKKLTVEAAGLEPVTSYSFAVIVKDPKGQKGFYTPKTVSTLQAPTFLTMFLSRDYVPTPFAKDNKTWTERLDEICNSDPQKVSDDYKALVVDGSTRRSCATPNCAGEREGIDWVLHPNQEYRDINETRIIATTNDKGLMPATLQNAIGNFGIFSMDAWSGLSADWTTGDTCSGWTSTSPSAKSSLWSAMKSSNYLTGAADCSKSLSIICVAQSEPTPDTVPPTVGTDIIAEGITANSITLEWGRATDNRTPVSRISYKLVTASSQGSINTVEKVDQISGAGVLLDWVPDITALSHTGLSVDTTYYYAVLARDKAGNKSLYPVKSFTTTAPTKRIFVTQIDVDGMMNLPAFSTSPLDTADSVCNSDPDNPDNDVTFKALIGHASRQACAGGDCTNSNSGSAGWVLSANTKYVRDDGTQIGTTNAYGVFTLPLTNAISTSSKDVWTGLNASWGVAGNCNNWSSIISEDSAIIGGSNQTADNAIEKDTRQCSDRMSLYCVEQ